MVLVKALCVVLLLHWANFVDSRSLKNETISQKRTVNIALASHPREVQARGKTSYLTQPFPSSKVSRPDPISKQSKQIKRPSTPIAKTEKPKAEDYSAFLQHLLEDVWMLGGFVHGPYDVSQNHNDPVFKGNGLYFIFGFKNEDEQYPLYIGMTGDTFKNRFDDHHDNKWPNNRVVMTTRITQTRQGVVSLTPHAYLINMPLPVAKFFESVFLSTFDFPLNKHENKDVRTEISTKNSQPAKVGRTLFLLELAAMHSKLKEAENLIKKNTMENSASNIHYY